MRSTRTFELLEPETWSVPAIFSSPHSGSFIPPDLAAVTQLSENQLRRSEDCYVDELFSAAPAMGAPLLRALVSRTYVDLNRDPGEFDQKMFDEPLPYALRSNSVRAHSGLGVVPRVISEGETIYRNRMSLADAMLRIERAYKPYHGALKELTDSALRHMGMSVVLDCHSMPHSASWSNRRNGQRSADIVLGDRFGTSCGEEIMSAWHHILSSKGLYVARNHPYPGGFITSCYGEPKHNRHALQIEINRSLYMNETSLEKKPGFVSLKASLTQCILEFNEALTTRFSSLSLRAAE